MAPSDTETVGLVEPRTREIALSAGTIEYQDTGGEGPVDRAAARPADGRLALGRTSSPTRWLPAHRPDAPARRPSPRHGPRRRPVAARPWRGWWWSSSSASTSRTSRWSATTRAARWSSSSRAMSPAERGPHRAGLLRRVRQLPARPDRQDTGAGRQAPTGVVRAVYAADALAAAAAAPARVRMADHARRRRHRRAGSSRS